jgi:hypothetical protein
MLDGSKTPNELIEDRLNSWLNNPPDYYTVTEVYDRLSELKRRARLYRGDISRIEDEVSIEVDKPRSTEAKKRKLEATAGIVAELVLLEAEIEYYSEQAKKFEYIRGMFASSSFALKTRNDILR